MKSSISAEKDLLQISTRDQWRAWLFHLENNLVASGYVGELTEEGRLDHAARMQGLYDFFTGKETERKQ